MSLDQLPPTCPPQGKIKKTLLFPCLFCSNPDTKVRHLLRQLKLTTIYAETVRLQITVVSLNCRLRKILEHLKENRRASIFLFSIAKIVSFFCSFYTIILYISVFSIIVQKKILVNIFFIFCELYKNYVLSYTDSTTGSPFGEPVHQSSTVMLSFSSKE